MNKNKRLVFFGGVGKPNEFGGELTKNKEIVKRLSELGCSITVLDSNNASRDKVKLVRIFSTLFYNMLFHPHSTFVFSTSFMNIYPLFKILYWWPFKQNIIYWVIGGNLSDKVASGIYKRRYLKRISLFVVEGVKMKKKMVDLGYNNVWYVPNFKTIGSLPKLNKVDDGKIHFVFLSRIIPDKGCDYILESAKRMNSQGFLEKFAIDFYGEIDCEYKDDFLKKVGELPNVKYAGKLNLLDEVNYSQLAKYHCMLFPTFWMGEGFPGVVIDSFKAGVPIIASDWSLNEEVIQDGKTGIIVPTHNVDRLVEAMTNAVNGEYDFVEMGKNCQNEVLKYNTSNVINKDLLQVITNISKLGGGKDVDTQPVEE